MKVTIVTRVYPGDTNERKSREVKIDKVFREWSHAYNYKQRMNNTIQLPPWGDFSYVLAGEFEVEEHEVVN